MASLGCSARASLRWSYWVCSDLDRDPGGKWEHLGDFEAHVSSGTVCPACTLDQTFPWEPGLKVLTLFQAWVISEPLSHIEACVWDHHRLVVKNRPWPRFPGTAFISLWARGPVSPDAPFCVLWSHYKMETRAHCHPTRSMQCLDEQ